MRGSVGRALVPVLGVLVLVGVVAVASTGSTPSGTTDSRPPADTLLDTFFSLALLALIPGAALLVYGLMQRKAIAREIASGKYRRMSLLGWLVLVTIGVAAFYVARPHFKNLGVGANDVVDLGSTTEGGAPENDPANGSVYEPEFVWVPVLLVVVLAAAGIAAYLLASRRRERVGLPERVAAEHVAERLGDDFDDLRTEPDPRRAVIAAYARLEGALASSGLPRRPAETPEEYVVRVLGALAVRRGPVRELTGLYERAKFSQHPIDEPMRERAIAALTRIRDELRELAERASQDADTPSAAEQAASS
ncbi:MAG TPA: DUF4129 domain-containing protein [Gaiellaceae bacterium]|nr:DUF4129 domain-containing protein [Gaiellaceae bacterium]